MREMTAPGAAEASAMNRIRRSCGIRVRFRTALEPVALQSAVERAAAEAKRLRGLAHVAVEARHGFLDQEALDVFEAHFVEAARGFFRAAQAEVGELHGGAW